jgi:hypothetical protein
MPDEVIEPTNIKLKSKLTYEEKPIQVLEEKKRRVLSTFHVSLYNCY